MWFYKLCFANKLYLQNKKIWIIHLYIIFLYKNYVHYAYYIYNTITILLQCTALVPPLAPIPTFTLTFFWFPHHAHEGFSYWRSTPSTALPPRLLHLFQHTHAYYPSCVSQAMLWRNIVTSEQHRTPAHIRCTCSFLLGLDVVHEINSNRLEVNFSWTFSWYIQNFYYNIW